MKHTLINKRVYYGEYTLKHWGELILTKNITLPDYQRHFVWEEADVRRLMDSLKSGQFIMPVTIAHYNDSVTSNNFDSRWAAAFNFNIIGLLGTYAHQG